jgi:hypothetical protein
MVDRRIINKGRECGSSGRGGESPSFTASAGHVHGFRSSVQKGELQLRYAAAPTRAGKSGDRRSYNSHLKQAD